MRGWPTAELGQVADSFDAARVPVREADRTRGPYPYYGASGIVDWVDGYLFDGEYLLVAEDGENLRTRKTPIAFLARGRFWVNNHAHVLRANNHADTRFLAYALARTDIGGYLSGSTQPKLTQASLKRIRVPAPPPENQRRIADLLSAFDDKIELSRRMNDTVVTLVHASFQHLMRDVPEKPLSELATIGRDTVSPAKHRETVYDHYSIPAFDNGAVPRAERGESIRSNKFLVPPNAVLLSKLNPRIARVWLPDVGERPAICSTEFIVLIPKLGIDREYLYALLLSPRFRNEFVSRVTGTSGSHQRVKPADALTVSVPVPDDSQRHQFASLARPALARVALNRRESRTLAELRDTLLPKLISGELRLRDADHEVETLT